MIDIPAIGGDVSLLEVVTAIALFATGYVLHEAMHVLPLKLWGHDYRVSILPTPEGGSRLVALFVGRVVKIDMLDRPPRSHVIVSALMPGVLAIFPLTALTLALAYPVVDIGTGLIILAWFSVSIPSAADWLTAIRYHPDRVDVDVQEVVADG